MDRPVVARWLEDGGDVTVDCGFLPSFAILFEDTEGTNPNIYFYSKLWNDQSTTLGALLLTGSSGVVTRDTDAMAEFDTKYQGVLVPNPAGNDPNFRVPTVYSSSTDYSGLEVRSTTAAGDVVWPTTRNGFVYELVTGTTTGSETEPTWPTTVGTTVTDGNSNVFTCRTEEVFTKGCQGLTVDATVQTDGQYSLLVAWESLAVKDVGDVANLATYDFVNVK